MQKMGPKSLLFFVNVLKISIFFVFIASDENADALATFPVPVVSNFP